MYASSLRRAGTSTRPRHARRVRPLGSGRPRSLAQQQKKGHASSAAAAEAGGGANNPEAWASGRSKPAGWRAPSVAGAVALVPVVGGAWLVTVYALRQRLCEHHLQQVEGADSTASRERERRRRSRNSKESGGSGSRATFRSAHQPLYPGSSADARGLRDMLARPASGVTVLCVDPPASYTGDAFVRSALLGRAATVHVRAGEGYGSLPACLARGLGVEFMAIKLQMSALLSGLGGDVERSGGGGGRGGPAGSSSTRELADIRAVLETATAALEEIRNQADDPRHHLPPVIIMDGLLGRIRAGEDVPAGVAAVLRWCWTVTGGRRLAHVVLTAPQSMAVDGSLVRAKEFLNDGRLAPGMMRVVALNAPDSKVAERRFRSRFTSASQPRMPQEGDGGSGSDGDGDEAEGERAVALCMELVHREGCAVAEDANEILRRTEFSDDKPGTRSASRLALDETLDDFALEAWRRVAAAVASASAHALARPDAAAGGRGGAGPGPGAVEHLEEGGDWWGVAEGGRAVAASAAAEDGQRKQQQQQQQNQQQEDDSEEPKAPRFRLRAGEAPASLEATAEPLRAGSGSGSASGTERERAALVERETALGAAAAAGAKGNVAAPSPVTPAGRLVGLLGELADGGKVTLEHAVGALDGDGKALAMLLDLGVLRLCPRTLSSPVRPVRVDTATGQALPLPLSLSLSASSPQKRSRNSTSSSPDVLAEAGAAFQVGAATPMMTGVFSILRGCVGVEEQAIARALHFLRGGRPDLGDDTGRGRDRDRGGFSTELEVEEEERQAWQAHREASMAVLVQRAMSAAPPPGQGGGGGPAAAERGRGRGRGGKGGRKSTSAYRSRRLQTALAAVGCMATWSEIYKELSAADAQGGLLADEKFLPSLLRTYRRAPPPPRDATTTSATTAAAGASRLQEQSSDRPRGHVGESLEEADAVAAGSGSEEDRGHAKAEAGGSPAAPTGHAGGEESGEAAGLEQSVSAEAGNETSVDLGAFDGAHDGAAREGETAPSSEGERGPAAGDGGATEGLPARGFRQGSSGIDVGRDGRREDGGGTEDGTEDGDAEAADTDGVAVAGSLRATVSSATRQQEEDDPGISENGRLGEEWRDGPSDGLQHETEDEYGEPSVSVAETSGDRSSVETDVAEEPTDASAADEPAADTAQETASPPPSSESESPSSETAAAGEEATPTPSSEGSSHEKDAPLDESRAGDDGSDGSSDGTAPSPEEDGGGPPQAQENVSGPEGEAAPGLDHGDKDDSGSGSGAGSNEEGGVPDLGAASGGGEASVDAAASAQGLPEANNVRSVLAADNKPLRERAASWAWVLPSWRSAGGKHH